MHRSLFLLGAAVLALAPALASAEQCAFTAQHDFDVDAAGLKVAEFELGSTDLIVEGVPGLAKVEVRGKACASEQGRLGELDVTQQRRGDRVVVTAHDATSNSGWGNHYAYLQLRVRVPTSLAVESKGSSADADIRGVAALNFQSSSGDLHVERIAGPLTVEVSSGDVQGRDIGSVDVDRVSSGDMQISDVRGDVRVDRCGSGDLTFDNVAGAVTIEQMGSGDVSMRHVDRDATVGSIGSGDVTASDIGGNFTVRSKGSGDVHHHDVRGTVSVPRDDD